MANCELPKLYYWCTANRITLNCSKTHYQIFSNRPIRSDLPLLVMKQHYSYSIITRVQFFKFLGVRFDEQLSFKFHIHYLTNKFSQIASLFFKLKDFVPKSLLINLYLAQVGSILNYCNSIWASTSQTHLSSLIILQKRIIRLITNSGYLDHTRPLLKSCKLLNITDLNKLHIIIDYFKENKPRNIPHVHHRYQTRNRNLPRVPSHSTRLFEKSFIYAGFKLYQTLPRKIKDINNLHKLQHELKNYFLSAY